MNYLKIFFAFSLLIMLACNGNETSSDSQESIPATSIPETPTIANPATTPPPSTPEPAQNADGVWHYTCPTGCEGGAGSAVPCPKCGTTLVHNTAYHGPKTEPTIDLTNPAAGQQTITPPPSTPEPAQNASGVWHYICSNGCAGGAGAKGPCPKCGAELTHNGLYHQ